MTATALWKPVPCHAWPHGLQLVAARPLVPRARKSWEAWLECGLDRLHGPGIPRHVPDLRKLAQYRSPHPSGDLFNNPEDRLLAYQVRWAWRTPTDTLPPGERLPDIDLVSLGVLMGWEEVFFPWSLAAAKQLAAAGNPRLLTDLDTAHPAPWDPRGPRRTALEWSLVVSPDVPLLHMPRLWDNLLSVGADPGVSSQAGVAPPCMAMLARAKQDSVVAEIVERHPQVVRAAERWHLDQALSTQDAAAAASPLSRRPRL